MVSLLKLSHNSINDNYLILENPNLNRGNPTLSKESVNNFNSNDIEDIEITTKPSSRPQLHVIRGRVVPYHEEAPTAKWATSTKIIVNYGEYYGFLK